MIVCPKCHQQEIGCICEANRAAERWSYRCRGPLPKTDEQYAAMFCKFMLWVIMAGAMILVVWERR